MVVNVHGWRKPTLYLELVEGGSLVANTTYYVAGFLKYTPNVYLCVGSPMSDVYTITTTSTHRSIQISHKTFRDITEFSNNGSNTLVTSERHCLATNDVIKIDSGSYAGTHTVTRIDANTFTIPVTYIDNTPVECYTDSRNYNKPIIDHASVYQGDTFFSNTYYVSSINPLSNNWATNAWTSNAYQNNNNTNPTTIITLPTSSRESLGTFETRQMRLGMFSEIKNYGTIFVSVVGTHSLQDIYNAVMNAGFVNSCYFAPNMNTFILIGSVHFGYTGTLTSTGHNITIILGEFTSVANTSAAAKVTLNNCLVNFIPFSQEGYAYLTANGSIFCNNRSAVGLTGYQIGSDNYYWGAPLLSGDTNIAYTNLATGLNMGANLINSKNYLSLGIDTNTQSSYGGQKWTNCKMPGNYYTLINSAINYEPNTYMMENCYIFRPGSLAFHYMFYQYPVQDGFTNKVKFLNIDVDRTDNKKMTINNRIVNMDASWWRRMEFNIIDENNNPVNNVNIEINDNSSNNYSGSSDLNGYGFVDVMEQKAFYTQAMGTTTSWNGSKDTYYNDFNITISKTGYETITLFVENAWDLKKQEVTLKPSKPILLDSDGKKYLNLDKENISTDILKLKKI